MAELCVLDLLHSSAQGEELDIQAIGFATPAIGNQALADYVHERGWQRYLTSYLLPGEHVSPVLRGALPPSYRLLKLDGRASGA